MSRRKQAKPQHFQSDPHLPLSEHNVFGPPRGSPSALSGRSRCVDMDHPVAPAGTLNFSPSPERRERERSHPRVSVPLKALAGTQNFAQRTPPARSQTPTSVVDVVLSSLNYRILRNTRRIALRIS
ncbi:hypothetical protein INR49_020273 [Caranx melampygus]|nr:hypothetical protein INR49_020273 [Caranx melampygus]